MSEAYTAASEAAKHLKQGFQAALEGLSEEDLAMVVPLLSSNYVFEFTKSAYKALLSDILTRNREKPKPGATLER
ncbi:hypothetical protein [Streptomyces sp. CoH17]|uniref:hypothetical protein n=1 Tax=Streptomyces sp. CoH17 TaxID=2992806 RepID=UPI00226DCE21|nr:hypothetical protein [Streptomyces sp. CoH17]